LAQRCWTSCSVTCAPCDNHSASWPLHSCAALCCLHCTELPLSDPHACRQAGALRGSLGIEMCVTAVANSRAMLLGTPLDLRTWKADLAARVALPCTCARPPLPHLWRSSACLEPAEAAYRAAYRTEARRRAGGAPGPGSGRTVGRRRAGGAPGPGGLHAAPGRRSAPVRGCGLHSERRRAGHVCQARLPAPCRRARAGRGVWSSL